jgi:hypothetical protein
MHLVAPLLGILFIALKLTGVIAWSWLWVLAPFWIGFALFMVFLAIMFIIAMAGAGVRFK